MRKPPPRAVRSSARGDTAVDDAPDHGIVGGNPAGLARRRHSEEDIARLLAWCACRNGVLLATDAYGAGPRPAPAVLVRLPYHKNSRYVFFEKVAERFTERGCVMAVQDVRGKFRPQGETLGWTGEAVVGRRPALRASVPRATCTNSVPGVASHDTGSGRQPLRPEGAGHSRTSGSTTAATRSGRTSPSVR
ncbi:CocE/NonD family hydrolase [Streptomyces enissocaesilis]|uniref:Xaa-Pro dipeptidyl-peptidase-like domain-containing protein n=1 Tax=Streptomyces enissocaesilis TaxID=332589 RepID=A0ABP6JT09_9ACTN